MFALEHRYRSPDDKSTIEAAERRPCRRDFLQIGVVEMSGVAGRSGRKRFVPTPDHRDLVKLLTTRGTLQEHIRQLIRNPQTGVGQDSPAARFCPRSRPARSSL